ncbi:MAG: AMP-binding protein [Firmicutes bacterium]|nr:AMP-binding protein [Bacillota bacterium]
MELLNKFLKKSDFESYEDFQANFKLEIPEDFDFARDVVDFWAENEPDKLALLYCNDDEEEIFFSFSDISLLSKKTAAYFKSLGIGKGDRVLLLLRRRWEYWVSIVALHRIGAVAIPASIQLTTKDLAYRINATKTKAVIAINDNFVLEQLYYMKELCNSLKTVIMVGGNSGTRKYNDFDKEMTTFEPDHSYSGLSNSDEMIIYATSATSGFPKMVSHNRTYPLGHIMTARYMQRVQNNGLHLTQSDSGWAKFGWGNIYGQWICGSAILAYDPERFHANKLMNVMEKFQPTSLCIPPTMYRFLLRDGLEKRHVESVKWFATAGEPLSGEVNKEFHDITGHFIHEGYGQSEGTPIACTFEWVDIRPASMGKPSPLYDVQIVRPDMTPCDVNENGEVVIFVHDKTPVGLLSHYSYEGETVCPYADGIYHTGDVAYRDEEGYFWYVSRNDDMIKSSGYRIGPFEIESVLNTHRAIKESAIIGLPDPMRGQIICAVVVLNDGYEGNDRLTKELQEYVKKNTAPYKYPRVIQYIDEMPKTTTGKIMRRALKPNMD